MDLTKPLTARELADATGLRPMDFDNLRPGVPRRSPPFNISADAAGIMTIEAKDAAGNTLTLRAQREGANYSLTSGDFVTRQYGSMRLTDGGDFESAGRAMAKLRNGTATNVITAINEALHEQGKLTSGTNALDWMYKRGIEQFHASAGQPMKFDTPSHMPKATPQEVIRYHLGNSFVAGKAPDGSITYTYTSDTTSKEKLVLTSGADGSISKVELNGKALPPTRETQETVLAAAKESAGNSRRGDTRNNPTIMGCLNQLLNNRFKHYNLEGRGDAHAYLGALTERAALAPDTAKSAPHHHGGKQQGKASLAMLAVTMSAAVMTAFTAPEARAQGEKVSIDQLRRSLDINAPGATPPAPTLRDKGNPAP
jgi:hypothetical protein